MVNFKKMDDKDFVFLNRPVNRKEDEAFSEFLKNREKAKKNENNKTKDKIESLVTTRQFLLRS